MEFPGVAAAVSRCCGVLRSSVLISANQGLLTGYPDGSFKPGKGVTRAEAAAILARLKAQLVLREKKGCEYVCTVGEQLADAVLRLRLRRPCAV